MTLALMIIGAVLAYMIVGSVSGVYAHRIVKRYDTSYSANENANCALFLTAVLWPLGLWFITMYYLAKRGTGGRDFETPKLTKRQQRVLEVQREQVALKKAENDELARTAALYDRLAAGGATPQELR